MTFLNHIEKFRNKVAIVENNKSFTYKDLEERSFEYCNKIQSRSLVFLLAENDLDTISFYLGLLKSKSVIVLLSHSLSSVQLKKLITAYKPNYILTSNKDFNFQDYKFFSKKNNYQIFLKKIDIKHNLDKDLAILMSTSGTTGSPKFVRLSYQNYKDNTGKIIKSLNINSKDSVMTTLPLNYTYGLSIINSYLSVGAKIFLNNNSIVSKNFWKYYQKYQPTSFYGVPFIYNLLSKLDYKNLFNKNLRFIANAGGKLDDKILKKNIEFSKNKGVKFYQMYGQTEASPRISFLNDKFNLSRFGSIGKPLKGGKFILLNKDKKKIKKPYTNGELIYYGKNVSLGYAFNFKDLIKGNVNNQKLFTGDIAYFDKDNFYYIVGRKSNFIKIFGHRIDISYLEDYLSSKGFKLKCSNLDNQVLLNYSIKNLNKELVINLLFKEFNINKNYIKFKYSKYMTYNTKKYL